MTDPAPPSPAPQASQPALVPSADPPAPIPPVGVSIAPVPPVDPMQRAKQAFSVLDPTGLRPTAIVLGVICALFFGSQLVNALIPTPTVAPGPGIGPGSGPIPPVVVPDQPADPGSGPLPPGSFLTAGPLRIPLVAGWQSASSTNNSAIASIVKGAVQVDLFSTSITGGTATPTAVYDTYMSYISENAVGFGNGQPAGIQIGGGLPAARGMYTGLFGGNQLEGEVTAFITGTTDGWVWDGWGPSGTLGALLPEIHSMIDNVQLVGGG